LSIEVTLLLQSNTNLKEEMQKKISAIDEAWQESTIQINLRFPSIKRLKNDSSGKRANQGLHGHGENGKLTKEDCSKSSLLSFPTPILSKADLLYQSQ
jgi:hypothetical protein